MSPSKTISRVCSVASLVEGALFGFFIHWWHWKSLWIALFAFIMGTRRAIEAAQETREKAAQEAREKAAPIFHPDIPNAFPYRGPK